MSIDRHKLVKEIFADALEKADPAERAACLAQACGDDVELRQSVEALLQTYEKVGAFLEEPAAALPGKTIALATPLTEKPGDKIGHYKLLQQIGEGGCGVVYMAEQSEPIRRRVALKVIKLGMDTKQVIVRFEAERQALALMDHPNIARVLDAGATETGRPYFVMELVRGLKLTDYCDQNNFSTGQRLHLFVQVCHAIQHAHQKGIIHRDIKPSNILVTVVDGQPVPKVIDFGIAKAIGQQLTDKTLFTAFEQFIGTPAYMSPEQAQLSGVDVDTRSDIYALGVLLYELLTGHTPFDPKTLLSAGMDEMRRIIREQDPPRPSTRISTLDDAEQTTVAKCRQAELPKLIHQVRGDLDWIVMKCLEKDRGRRYETANNVALDIEHHLQHEPVTAAAPGTLYRAHKFIRRHRTGLAMAAALVLLLAAGAVVSTWQAVRATRAEREQARLRQRAEAARVRAEANEKKAATEATRSAQVTRFLKDMLQSAEPGAALGQDTKLLRGILDRTAERLGKDLTNQPAVEAELRLTVGTTYRDIGLPVEAEAMTREALRLSRTALCETNQLVADSLIALASVLIRFDRTDNEAERSLRQALAIQEKLPVADAKALADAMDLLSRIIRGQQDKLAEAETLTREALALRRELFGSEHPEVAKSLNNLGLVLRNQGKLDEAEATIRKAMEILKKIPAEAHPELAWSLHCLASVLDRQGKLAEAEAAYREAMAMERMMNGEDNWYTDTRPSDLAIFLRNHGKQAELETLFRETVERRRGILGDEHPRLAVSLADLVNALLMAGKFTEAEPVARECLAIREKKLPDDWLAFHARSLLGGCLLGQKRYAEAEPLLLTGYAGMEERQEKSLAANQWPNQWRLREAFDRLVKLYQATGRAEKVTKLRAQWYRKEVERLRKAAAGDNLEAANNLAWLLATCNDPAIRDGASAINLAEKAVAGTNRKNAMYLDTLAAAWAEAGQFDKAVALQKEAMALLQDERSKQDYASRLKLYESNTPYHAPE